MPALMSNSLPALGPPRVGKVREVYDLGDEVLIVATDRISAFDVIMANGIPDKGRVLNRMSAFWFEKFKDICPNHIVSTDDYVILSRLGQAYPELGGRCTLARKAEPLTIECVVRGYLAGSLYKEYRDSGGDIHGLDLPAGLTDSDQLLEPIFTPATKAQTGHDENISFDEAVNLVGRDTAEFVRDRSIEIYQRAAAHALAQGIILADTKFEFGTTPDGIIWIDEALTPDSSRFWDAARYEPGHVQPSYDKQFVRDYLETIRWDKRPPGPTLPDEVVAGTRARYIEAFERLTGSPFSCSSSTTSS